MKTPEQWMIEKGSTETEEVYTKHDTLALPSMGRVSILTKEDIEQIQLDAQAELKVENDSLKASVAGLNTALDQLNDENQHLRSTLPTTAQIMVYHSLLRKYEALQTQLAELTTERDNARGLLGKAELELAELTKDKERLDWLFEKRLGLLTVKEKHFGEWVTVYHIANGNKVLDHPYPTPRQSIDAARKETK